MSNYKQTRDAAGKVTTQYDKMLRNLDDDLTCTGCGEYAGSPIADRIEQLVATCEQLEAKLAKAVEALEDIGNRMGELSYSQVGRYAPAVARKALAELKGQNDD